MCARFEWECTVCMCVCECEFPGDTEYLQQTERGLMKKCTDSLSPLHTELT